MRFVLTSIALVLLVATLAPALDAQQAPAAARQDVIKPITVPQGDGAPVMTDGIFTPGEWDDALAIAVQEGVTLYLKEYRGVVFVGVRGTGGTGVGPSEVSLAVPNGAITKLHVSFALSQIALPATGPEPKMRLGFTTDWYANEFRMDEEAVARQKKAEDANDPSAFMMPTTFPSEGIEFAIRRSKFPGNVWLMRLWVTGIFNHQRGTVTYPPSAPERTTDGWLELRFK
jgi:hypothetical protein